MNYRIVSHLLGLLALGFSVAFLALLPFGIWYADLTTLSAMVKSIVIGAIVGGTFWLLGRGHTQEFFRREAVAVTALAWIVASILGTLPFYFGGLVPSFVDCFFESTSGLTTTGSSILTSISDKPSSLLFWRSFLHFIGGFGIIVFFVALMPSFAIGGKTLFKQEVAGHVVEGITPRIKDTALKLFRIYIGLVVLLALALLLFGGMTFFEAINHSMAAVATGGYSTENTSALEFRPLCQWILIAGMLLSGTNFTLHVEALKGNWKIYFRDPEFRCYAALVLGSTLLIASMLYFGKVESSTGGQASTLRDAMFAVTTCSTTTGFATADYNTWPGATRFLLVTLMIVGGMVGSTTGGLKVIRFVILMRSLMMDVRKELSPREVGALKVGNRPVSGEILRGVLGYFVVYMLVMTVSTILVGVFDWHLTTEEALTGVIACLNGCGPGLGVLGPVGNFSSISDVSKIILCVVMLLGRLEIYPILLVCSWRFWFPK
ncbi:TrkH family potassium uptake protein [bacterium]|nr:TrkH family potassium uptake protein [bacterium]